MNFIKASPVWAKNLQEKFHINIGLTAKINYQNKPTFIKLATSGFYKLYVNGEFVNYGPIRAAHGYFRMDEIDITKYLTEPQNFVAIEAVSYCMQSFYSLKQSAFIQAEISTSDDNILAYTDERNDDFTCYYLSSRIRKMQVYSYQRTIVEGYRLNPNSYDWRMGKASPDAEVFELQWTGNKKIIDRELKLHSFNSFAPQMCLTRGNVTIDETVEPVKELYFSYRDDDDKTRAFAVSEIEFDLCHEILKQKLHNFKKINSSYTNETILSAGEFELLAFPYENTGFISFDVECDEDTELYFTYDEVLDKNGLVDPFRFICLNALYTEFKAGKYHFMAMEPMGFKYINIVCKKGGAKITNFALKEYVNPYDKIASLNSDDEKEQLIFDAAWHTLQQNAAEIFTDCPTRERAGWLCDSYFIGRASQFFTGDMTMEKQFLENFIMHPEDEHLPFGMLPQCYPSDSFAGSYIVNWTMWYIAELNDYIKRGGDKKILSDAKELVYNLLACLKRLEDKDGLLVKLPGWAFVEWSKANDLVQDINFPNNMVYSYALRLVGKLYDDKEAYNKGEALRKLIIERSFNGEFFVDNEVYDENGVPVSSGETTETCQYHAFFFDIVTPESHPDLWKKLSTEFGPEREKNGLYPNVHPSNAFTGNFMRLDILLRYGEFDQCRREVVGYFYEMAKLTGTLWENMTDCASCNHGFAAYAAELLYNSINKITPNYFK